MSDRIDELVGVPPAYPFPRFTQDDALGYLDELLWNPPMSITTPERCRDLVRWYITELATIAREAEARALKAEAMCEWLAGKVSDRDALAATRDGWSFRSPGDWLAAAREAVK